MSVVLNAKYRLTASVHCVFPVGGGSLWRNTNRADRLAILKKFPHRTDLDIDAPYAPGAREPVKIDRGHPNRPLTRDIKAPRHTHLDLSLPERDREDDR